MNATFRKIAAVIEVILDLVEFRAPEGDFLRMEG